MRWLTALPGDGLPRVTGKEALQRIADLIAELTPQLAFDDPVRTQLSQSLLVLRYGDTGRIFV